MDKTAQLLRIKDVAELLGVTTRTVYRRIWAGELPASKIGGLYYIKRADLESLLNGGALKFNSDQPATLLKCGVCLRILASTDQVAANCAEAGCDAPICRSCAAQGYAFCRQHVKNSDEKWTQAQKALEAGEIDLLVSGNQARLSEMNYLNRIRGRLAQIETLLHPLSGDIITIKDWESLLTQGDERAEVLRLKGRVLLDTRDTSQLPMNAWLHYRIPQSKGQAALPLDIHIKVFSRLSEIVAEGFTTHPLKSKELGQHLVALGDDLKSPTNFQIVVLASTSGWDDSARQSITGSTSADSVSAFSHPKVLLYLYDMQTNALIYNHRDSRLAQYAELFKPMLLEEEIVEVKAAIESLLIRSGHSSLTLGDAVDALPYSERVIRESFLDMEKSGKYRVVELTDLGIAIQKSNLQ